MTNSLNLPSREEWTFVGVATASDAEQFPYYFHMSRRGHFYHVISLILNGQNKKILLSEEADAKLDKIEENHWRVGNAFLQFYPISKSWVFGLKLPGPKGFNFRVDMLNEAEKPVAEHTYQGIKFSINQSARLNGHLKIEETGEEQFVVARKTWFKQIWIEKNSKNQVPITSVLCQFDDGSGFYMMDIKSKSKYNIKKILWPSDEKRGQSIVPSALSILEDQKGDWHIKVASVPFKCSYEKLCAKVDDYFELFTGSAAKAGFCALNKIEVT